MQCTGRDLKSLWQECINSTADLSVSEVVHAPNVRHEETSDVNRLAACETSNFVPYSALSVAGHLVASATNPAAPWAALPELSDPFRVGVLETTSDALLRHTGPLRHPYASSSDRRDRAGLTYLCKSADASSIWVAELKDSSWYDSGRQKVVLKVISRHATPQRIACSYKEVAALDLLKPHRNVVHLAAPALIETENEIITLLEHLNGPDLHTVLTTRGALEENAVRSFMRGALGGLQHIHDGGLIHLDIKPENLVLRDSTDLSSVCYIDFEACSSTFPPDACGYTENFGKFAGKAQFSHKYPESKAFTLDELKGTLRYEQSHLVGLPETRRYAFGKHRVYSLVQGTPGYLAPETIVEDHDFGSDASPVSPKSDGFADAGAVTHKCDSYSLGIVFFMLLTGYHPFCIIDESVATGSQCASLPAILKLNREGDIERLVENHFSRAHTGRPSISEEAKDLLLQLCERDSSSRLSARGALAHSWFRLADSI